MYSTSANTAKGNDGVKIDEKFNLKSAQLVEVQQPYVKRGPRFALGMSVEFYTAPGSDDRRTLRLHLTPLEALKFAQDLIEAARLQLEG